MLIFQGVFFLHCGNVEKGLTRTFIVYFYTLPETNSQFAPANGWLEYFLVSFWGPAYFQVRTVSFRECICFLPGKLEFPWIFEASAKRIKTVCS